MQGTSKSEPSHTIWSPEDILPNCVRSSIFAQSNAAIIDSKLARDRFRNRTEIQRCFELAKQKDTGTMVLPIEHLVLAEHFDKKLPSS